MMRIIEVENYEKMSQLAAGMLGAAVYGARRMGEGARM